MRASRTWFVIAGVALLSGLTVLARDEDTLDIADKVASVLSFVVGGAALCLGLRKEPLAGENDDETARKLFGHVRRQWQKEIGLRLLQHPRPLRLRWSPSQSMAAGIPPAKPGRLERGEHAARQLVALVRRTRPGQLVVLGAPGSGKSSLMALFTVDAIDLAEPGDPVPVLLALPTWHMGEPLDDWIARRIDEDYPGLAGRLVREQRIMPVLDGLDELGGPALARAFDELNRIAPTLPGLIVTCRPGEYEKAVIGQGPLSTAAVVRIEPVTPDDAIAFLTESDLRGSTRWKPVADRLRSEGDGALATIFASPLMISLARSAYRSPDSDPKRLLTMDAATAEQHLLDGFLTNAYPGAESRRWLRVLATGTRMRWWTLATQVHPTVLVATIGLIVATLGAAAGAGFAAVSGYRPGAATAYAAVTGLAVGVLAGRRAGRVDEPAGMFAVIAAALRDGLVSGATFAAGATVVLMTATTEPAVDFLGPFGVLGVVGGTVLGIISNGLAAGRRMVPGRFGRRLRTLPRRLGDGCLTASLFAFPAAAVIAALDAVQRWEPERGWLAVVPEALLDTLITGAVGALVIGLPIGVGRWLSVPGDIDEGADITATFRSSLRAERETLLVTTAGAALAVGAVTAAVVVLAGGGLAGLGGGSTGAAAALAAGLAAVLVAVLVAFGSGAPWVAYTIARLWLTARGRLPRDLTGFLEDAHRREVLRQDGPAYRFRHERLRSQLAGGPPSVPEPDPSAVRRRSTVVTAVAGVVIMLVTGVTVVPDAVRTVGRKLAATTCRVSITIAVAPEYRDALSPIVDRFNRSRSAVCKPVELVGGSSDPLAAPDPDQVQVWIPASASVVDLFRHRNPGAVVGTDTDRLVHDPLVLAVPTPLARQFVGADWQAIVRSLFAPASPLQVVVPNPARSIAGLGAVHEFSRVVAGETADLTPADIASPEVRRGVAEIFARATITDDVTGFLCNTFWRTVVITRQVTVDQATQGRTCGSGRPGVGWVTFQLTNSGLREDMPYAVLSSAGAAQRLLAGALREFLWDSNRKASPYRLGEPSWVRGRWLPDPELLPKIAAMWDGVRPPVTAVLLVDASESMSEVRRLVQVAVGEGLTRIKPGDRLGLWTFSRRLNRTDPGFRIRVPTGSAVSVRERVAQELAAPPSDGDTPLHAAILGVQRHIEETEPPGQPVNLIVVTDGGDTSGISGREVVDAVRRRGRTTVRIIEINIGRDLYVPAGLTEISGANGDVTFTSVTTGEAAEAFRTTFTFY